MIGVLTTLGQDHLDRYNSVQGYWAAKRKMFANQSADQLAIHNADQPEQTELLAGLAAMQRTYSLRSVLSEGAFMDGGTLFLADNEYVQRICHVSELQLIGRHNIANVLAASLAAYFAGAPVAAVRQASLEFQPLPHRLEKVAVIRNVSYINNSMCTNPQAAVASLNAFSENLVVIAGGAGKNLDIGPMLDGLARQAKYVVLIGSEAEQVRNGLLRRGFNAVTTADSLEDAVLVAARHAEAGDVVILNPGFASFDQFRDFEDRGEKFRRCVQSLANT
jgi:UDP-N-acetylmuramoylalanine--D-glutamate ligase